MEKVPAVNGNYNPNRKNFRQDEDKPFYAAYLNTAVHNIYTIFKDVSESLELPFKVHHDYRMLESVLIRKLEENDEPELSQKIIERLTHQFSFLNILSLNNARNGTQSPVSQAEATDHYQVIKLWVSQLFQYRNFYSHALHAPVSMDSAIIDGLRTLYDADWKEFKNRKALSVEDTQHLIRLGKNGESPYFQYPFLNKQGALTEAGFLYFVCLWLEKKDAQEFLKKHKGFKRGESKSQKATLEKFTWFRTKVPKPRLTSDNSQQGLFMDMVNDLKRCPTVLFDLLSDEDKARFYVEDDEAEEDGQSEYETKPYLVRKTNRFYYFAMRYLELRFEHLKFHIDLGNYCFKTYDQIIEGVPRKRRWISRITAFGNLIDFRESEPPSAWKDKLLSKDETEKPPVYITPTTPHYHFDPNSKVKVIGMKWVKDYKKDNIWPDIESAGMDQKYRNDPPDFWLSLYELPSLIFYQILHEKGLAEHSAEQIVMNHKKKLHKGFLDNVAQERIIPGFTKAELEEKLKQLGLSLGDIPTSIVSYLLSKNTQSTADKAKMRLRRLKEENASLLSKLERQESHYNMKPGSKNYVALKAGVVADFLAHDMLLLQKPIKEDQGKANSTEFQVLQAKLAYFSQNKKSLNETLRLCNLIDAPNSHPFLDKIEVAKCRGIVDFYKKYLLQRARFLEYCIREQAYAQYHFLKIRAVPNNIKTLIARQQKAVLNLPRGLFKSHIQMTLQKHEQNETFKRLVADNHHNNAYIIQQYFELITKDKNQAFYSFKRNYDLLTELYDTRKPKDRRPAKRKFLTPEQMVESQKEIKQKLNTRIEHKLEGIEKNSSKETQVRQNYTKQHKQLMDNEKTIRLFKTCDMLQFLLVDRLYQQLGLEPGAKVDKKRSKMEFTLGENYKLKEIMPDEGGSILSLKTEVALPLYFDKHSGTERKMVIRDEMKVKNYGDFRLFLKDRRIAGLLAYIEQEEISYGALKRELEEFDKCRKVVLKEILKFERGLVKKFNLELEGDTFFSHEVLLEKVISDTEDLEKMKQLRNAFFHSVYPEYGAFENKVSGRRFNELKDYATEDKEVDQKSIIHQLKNLAIHYYRHASGSF